ncbi:translation elongation factor Ts [Salinibacter ruber]|uniref:Elongation factor Ts n=1 Tax=Salinibacter ruber (strain M8) TaxID=761659 RepID=D5H4J9_SALRM|nr:translation elongation factor Ts [Salinibacter ruber]MCS3627898.1 elongation factor Ts [Salinibacter ruber]MCS3826732.1 elongation factor Ts [Salinibacter ruber]MCS3954379.1 elongation factor Ts [Salinibacter ruber]MCS4041080.1 elongation factor Ts [Salinibacter ruber]MCS4086338.1 elongation factor Ts [Salinibacter ruber]
MSVSAKQVKELRDATGVGMMDCKEALQETDGDFDEAVSLLRKKGQEVADDRAAVEADEGLVVTAVSDDGHAGAIVEINCETDFVARNEDFQSFAETAAERVLEETPDDLEALESLPYEDDVTIEEELVALTGRIGEKLTIRRFDVLESEEGQIISYVHPGSKLGVLVEVHGDGEAEETGRDVAMQVAALEPIAVTRDEVPDEVKEEEREVAREAAVNEGKPEHVIDNIVEGKLERFFEDHVLMEQAFVKDSSVSVKDMLDDADLSVARFTRYALGD